MLRIPTARRPRRLLALSLAALAVFGACGGDDDDDTAATTAEPGTDGSLPATITAGSTTAAPPPTATAATPASATPDTATSASAASGDIEPYIEAGAEAIGTDDEEAARCLSTAFIDAVGPENVLATGLSPEEFYGSASIEATGVVVTDQIREDVEANVLGCGDLVQAITDSIEDETEADCVRQTLTNELIAEQVAVGLVGATPSPELQEALAEAQTCATG